jgi:hypothetical protein
MPEYCAPLPRELPAMASANLPDIALAPGIRT